MEIKEKLFTCSIITVFILGIISAVPRILGSTILPDNFYPYLMVILFLLWLKFDTDEHGYSFSRVLITSFLLLVPFFWYIFKTRKLKGGFIFLGKALLKIFALFFVFNLSSMVLPRAIEWYETVATLVRSLLL